MVVRKRQAFLAGVILSLAMGTALAGHGVYLAAKARLAQVLLEHAWDQTRLSGAPYRPWFWADTYPVARLRVPALDIERMILAGDSGRTLAFGPGHRAGTALPGTRGVSIVSAHRDTHFRFLAYLENGDELSIERADGFVRRYTVRQALVLDLDREQLALDPTADRLVLTTCYPFRQWTAGGSKRYVVVLAPRDATGYPGHPRRLDANPGQAPRTRDKPEYTVLLARR
jgi:sortase A